MKVFLSVKIVRLLVLFDLLGCKGSMAQLRDSNAPRQRRRLVDVSNQGNNGRPTSAFPLGKCQGDCDTDNDCAGNLKCYQRSSGGTVPPGCSGTPTGSNDYCYDPNDSAPPPSTTTLRIVGDNKSPSSVFPLGQCQGDCDTDSECAVGLVCFQRSMGQAVPGCRGTPDGSTDYCVRREDLPPTLTDVGDNFDPRNVFPLGRCEGDCDGDSGKKLYSVFAITTLTEAYHSRPCPCFHT